VAACTRKGEQYRFLRCIGLVKIYRFRPSACQGARFIKHRKIDFSQPLKCTSILHQNACTHQRTSNDDLGRWHGKA
jgi:hypothetical protein